MPPRAKAEYEVATKDSSSGVVGRIGESFRGLDRDVKQINRTTANMARSFASARNILAGFGVTIGAFQLNNLIRESLRLARTLEQTAFRVDVTTEELQALTIASEQLAGVQAGTLGTAIQRFSRRLGEAAAGTGVLLPITEQYNFALRDQNDRLLGTFDALTRYADLIKNAATEQEALRLTVAAFDSEGAGLVNVFRQLGGEGIQNLISQLQELGIILEDDLIRGASQASRELDILGTSIQNNLIAGILTNFADASQDIRDIYTDPQFVRSVRAVGRALGDVVEEVSNVVTDLGLLAAEFGELFDILQNLVTSRTEFLGEAARRLGDLFSGRFREGLQQGLEADGGVEADLEKGLRITGFEFIDTQRGAAIPQAGARRGRGTEVQSEEEKQLEREIALAEELAIEIENINRQDEQRQNTIDGIVQSLREQLDVLRQVDQTQVNIDRLRELGASDAEIETAERLREEIQLLEQLQPLAESVGRTLAQGFESAVFEAENLNEAINQIGESLIRLVFQQTVTQPVANAISTFLLGLGAGAGGAAGGARVQAGEIRRVGELGEELFIAPADGVIVPNSQMGGAQIVQNFNIAAETGPAELAKLERTVNVAVKRSIDQVAIQQRRNFGVGRRG